MSIEYYCEIKATKLVVHRSIPKKTHVPYRSYMLVDSLDSVSEIIYDENVALHTVKLDVLGKLVDPDGGRGDNRSVMDIAMDVLSMSTMSNAVKIVDRYTIVRSPFGGCSSVQVKEDADVLGGGKTQPSEDAPAPHGFGGYVATNTTSSAGSSAPSSTAVGTVGDSSEGNELMNAFYIGLMAYVALCVLVQQFRGKSNHVQFPAIDLLKTADYMLDREYLQLVSLYLFRARDQIMDITGISKPLYHVASSFANTWSPIFECGDTSGLVGISDMLQFMQLSVHSEQSECVDVLPSGRTNAPSSPPSRETKWSASTDDDRCTQSYGDQAR